MNQTHVHSGQDNRAIQKLLVANRGEIAIRIARTAHDLGIKTLAIYSIDDKESLHWSMMQEACELSGKGVAAYLDIENIIQIAVANQCDAIHPGYGLLSENPVLAQACEEQGLIFVGPQSKTLKLFGDKVSARRCALDAGLPVVDALEAADSPESVKEFFIRLGNRPLMLKAVSGGGGRGMRIINCEEDVEPLFRQCQAEADHAFGQCDIYAERFLSRVRHIEVQIIGDGQDVVHLWERDCSIQRRNQKIIELAPAPLLATSLRNKLVNAAITIAKQCHYLGVGTVEFLVDCENQADEHFYFMELNPRIQVEHTITEVITGLDLVDLQLRIAAGATLADLALFQNNIALPRKMAMQLRLNAESYSPDTGWVPSVGKVKQWYQPGGRGVRVDSDMSAGKVIGPQFDSLIAKCIVEAECENFDKHTDLASLSLLIQRALNSLSEFRIEGVETNIEALKAVLLLPELQEWKITVAQIEQKLHESLVDFSVDHSGKSLLSESDSESGCIMAPLAGVAVEICVRVGERVKQGQVLALLEAMKMQHEVIAPQAGTVLNVLVEAGDLMIAGQPVVIVEESEEDVLEEVVACDNNDLDALTRDLEELQARLHLTDDVARPEAMAKLRNNERLSVREKIAVLFAQNSFHEYGQLAFAGQTRRRDSDELRRKTPADGVVTGVGLLGGDSRVTQGDVQNTEEACQVALVGYDTTVIAGTQGIWGHKKTDRILAVAKTQQLPLVLFTEGGGGRPGDVDFADVIVAGLNYVTFKELARHQPLKIALNSGNCFAGNAAIFGCCDITIATRDSSIGMGGPAMIEGGGLGAFTPAEVGPVAMQASIGAVDIVVDNEQQGLTLIKQLVRYVHHPKTCYSTGKWITKDQRLLRHLIPENRKRVYSIHNLIETLVDTGSYIDIKAQFGEAMVTGLAQVEGKTIGVMANNPAYQGGAIDASAARKASALIDLCQRFNIPVLSLCDTPGFMVGPESERQGNVSAATELLNAGANANVPFMVVCLRKAYGLGAMAMAGGSFAGPLFTIAWPSGEFGGMGLESGVRLACKKELEALPDEDSRRDFFEQRVAEAYEAGRALSVASVLEIDAVIDPCDTRQWINSWLQEV